MTSLLLPTVHHSNLDTQPLVLRIWDISKLKLECLVQQTMPILKTQWNPVIPYQLAFCCGNGLIYLWDKASGCDAIEVPAVDFDVVDFNWNPNGKSLMLLDKNKFCLAFLVEEE